MTDTRVQNKIEGSQLFYTKSNRYIVLDKLTVDFPKKEKHQSHKTNSALTGTLSSEIQEPQTKKINILASTEHSVLSSNLSFDV